MPTESFTNNASSTLNGAINNSVTSLVVTSAASFPTLPQFRIKIDNELMLVTALSGATYTVTRGIEGTAAASHSSGAPVTHIVTAASLVKAGGWVTAYDLDFTAEGSQTLSSNGNYTIGGKTWTKFNSSNEATAMAVTNGTGLVVQPSSTTDYNGGTRTLPGIYLPLTSIIPDFDLGMALRIWAYVSAFSGAANYDNAVLGVDTQSTGLGFIVKRGYGTGGQGFESSLNVQGANQGFFSRLVTVGATNDSMILEIPMGSGSIIRPSFGDYSSGWPSETSLSPCKQYTGSGTIDNTAATGSNLSLFLGAQRAGSGTSLSVTFARLRVDYKP